MLTSSARFGTEHASRYLQQLCKHFGHKVAVDFDPTSGRAELPPGPAEFKADAEGLDMTVTAQDDQGLARAKFIIQDHLERFAHREAPVEISWSA